MDGYLALVSALRSGTAGGVMLLAFRGRRLAWRVRGSRVLQVFPNPR